jgi:hypothetical protein
MDSYDFDSFDSYDIEYDRGGYDDSDDCVAEDNPSPEEVSAFWDEVRPHDVEAPF